MHSGAGAAASVTAQWIQLGANYKMTSMQPAFEPHHLGILSLKPHAHGATNLVQPTAANFGNGFSFDHECTRGIDAGFASQAKLLT